MLTIRKEQLAAFEENVVHRFKKRLRLHLEAHLREMGVDLPGQLLTSSVDRDFADAQRFGFLREREIARFASIATIHLRDADGRKYPRSVLEFLHDRTQAPEARLDQFETWARAAGDRRRAAGA